MHKMWLLVLLLLVPGTQAALEDETDFPQTYFARVAQGDIPRTAPIEGGGWNVVEYLRVAHDGNETSITVDGVFDFVAECSCSFLGTSGRTLTISSSDAAGDHVLAIRHSHTASPAFSPPLGLWNTAGHDAGVVLYVPQGKQVSSNVQPTVTLPGAQQPNDIYQFEFGSGDPLDGNVWFTIHPELGGQGTTPTAVDRSFDFLALVMGILAGALVWAVLVQKGYVQKRRRQEVAVSAHVEAAKRESKASLEARKRVLMAGLKELEKAKANKEIEAEVYDSLKSELKKEAVTAMRAIEQAE